MIDFTFQLFIKLENFSVCCFVNFLKMISCDNKIVCRTLFFLVDYVLPSYLFPHLQIRYIIEIITPNQREWSRAILPVMTSCDPRDHVSSVSAACPGGGTTRGAGETTRGMRRVCPCWVRCVILASDWPLTDHVTWIPTSDWSAGADLDWGGGRG